METIFETYLIIGIVATIILVVDMINNYEQRYRESIGEFPTTAAMTLASILIMFGWPFFMITIIIKTVKMIKND